MNNKQNKVREALKLIPSIDEILKEHKISGRYTPLDFIKNNLNNKLNEIRKDFQSGKIDKNPKKYINHQITQVCNKSCQNSLKPVINGTGII